MAFGCREMGKGYNLFDWAANESFYTGALSIDRCPNIMLQVQFIPKCHHHRNGGWISTNKTLFSLTIHGIGCPCLGREWIPIAGPLHPCSWR